MTVTASKATKDEVLSVPSDTPVVDYIVAWAAVSVHIDGASEPVVVPQGERLPVEAAGQGPFLKSIGAVTAVAKTAG